MKKPAAIHLAPAHPCMGWVSMNRYWQALREQSVGEPGVRSLVQAGPVEAPGWPWWQKQVTRRWLYPILIRRRVKEGILHVLDHSFASLVGHAGPGIKKVVTVHDLIPLSHSGDLSPSQQRRYRQEVSWLERADALVCVSEHTKAEVSRLLKISAPKLHVIPNGTTCLPAPDLRMQERLAMLPPFVLSVGGVRPRKNLSLLVPLAEHWPRQQKDQKLIIVRAGALLPESLAADIRKHAHLHELGTINDAELSAAYSLAALTLVPSLHEGFGLPVLEAMQAGCPVVYSRATSLPEVAGEAGLAFEPNDAVEAARHCLRIMNDVDLRVRLTEAGRERASQFSWHRHWQGLMQVYRLLQAPLA